MICKKCGKEISSNDRTCPECGCAVTKKNTKQKYKKQQTLMNLLLVTLIITLVVIVLLMFCKMPQSGSDTSEPANETAIVETSFTPEPDTTASYEATSTPVPEVTIFSTSAPIPTLTSTPKPTETSDVDSYLPKPITSEAPTEEGETYHTSGVYLGITEDDCLVIIGPDATGVISEQAYQISSDIDLAALGVEEGSTVDISYTVDYSGIQRVQSISVSQ